MAAELQYLLFDQLKDIFSLGLLSTYYEITIITIQNTNKNRWFNFIICRYESKWKNKSSKNYTDME